MVAITLNVHTDDPETVARTVEVLARAAAGLALETGLDDGVTISILRFEPDPEDR
jgi:hypothetical protein